MTKRQSGSGLTSFTYCGP